MNNRSEETRIYIGSLAEDYNPQAQTRGHLRYIPGSQQTSEDIYFSKQNIAQFSSLISQRCDSGSDIIFEHTWFAEKGKLSQVSNICLASEKDINFILQKIDWYQQQDVHIKKKLNQYRNHIINETTVLKPHSAALRLKSMFHRLYWKSLSRKDKILAILESSAYVTLLRERITEVIVLKKDVWQREDPLIQSLIFFLEYCLGSWENATFAATKAHQALIEALASYYLLKHKTDEAWRMLFPICPAAPEKRFCDAYNKEGFTNCATSKTLQASSRCSVLNPNLNVLYDTFRLTHSDAYKHNEATIQFSDFLEMIGFRMYSLFPDESRLSINDYIFSICAYINRLSERTRHMHGTPENIESIAKLYTINYS